MVWLGIDLGDARVGLALSDPGITLAYPAGNIQVYGDSCRALADEVVDVIEDELVDHVIVGLPLLLSGEEGKSAKKARRWTVNLERRLRAAVEDDEYSLTQVPTIELVDERLTTVTAHHQLFDAQIGGHEHRPMVDQQSAVVILQTAIDRRKR